MSTMEEELAQLFREDAERMPINPRLLSDVDARVHRKALQQRVTVTVAVASVVAFAAVSLIPSLLETRKGDPKRPVVASGPSDGLVPAPPLSLSFPVTPGYLPAGLQEPQLLDNSEGSTAAYNSLDVRGIPLALIIEVREEPTDPLPHETLRPITINDVAGSVAEVDKCMTIRWERKPKQHVLINSCQPDFAKLATLVRIAEGLVDEPQVVQVGVQVALAPAGYEVVGLGPTHALFAPTGSKPSDTRPPLFEISLQPTHLPGDGGKLVRRSDDEGARSVKVGKRTASLFEKNDQSVAWLPLSSEFVLEVSVPSGRWSEEQFLRLVEGVDFVGPLPDPESTPS